ncbi:MAG TPA: hypothetical protein PK719_05025 [Bacteroidales bacterium]|jgi:hypothetical protein|nr:hypothetical protein [Bacteroidales bacterium]OQB60606.1 MAG: hypothetical protein BWX96_02117 [Bacteroidetes bacterium ADurb.Bin145]HOU02471.1 hypothetical protein [Bacteroidales bacterium]HQG62996.1 hypothetical protein [Bacteroidales bacterium]HQK68703.1 hypothetical protein [Bacteroidales bacterium]
MKRKLIFIGFILLVNLTLNVQKSAAQISLDLESGYVSTGYNNIRIPGDQGTDFSLSEELKAEGKMFYRLRLNYNINSRNTISVLYAPLTVNSKGSVPRDILFENVLFPANTDLDATYKFNSYRLTYRYELVQKPKFNFGIGFTAKIRDAKIALASGDDESEKVNVGFVPIINFRLSYNPIEKIGILFEGDALAAPQGRAEDVLLALTYKASDRIGIKAGYRILEGGADNDEVYTFSLFHYAAAGLFIRF